MTVAQLTQEYKDLDISLSQRERWSGILGDRAETLSIIINGHILSFSSLPQEIRQECTNDIISILRRTIDE